MNEEERQDQVIQGHKDIVEAIRSLETRMGNVEKFMETMNSYLQGIAGLGILGKALMSLGGVATAYIAIKTLFTGHL